MNQQIQNGLNRLATLAVTLGIGTSILNSCIYDGKSYQNHILVKGGSRAVIFDRLQGVKSNVINEGTHFVIPWLQKAIIFDIRTKPRNTNKAAAVISIGRPCTSVGAFAKNAPTNP